MKDHVRYCIEVFEKNKTHCKFFLNAFRDCGYPLNEKIHIQNTLKYIPMLNKGFSGQKSKCGAFGSLKEVSHPCEIEETIVLRTKRFARCHQRDMVAFMPL
jgi:hypothetical protein